MKNATAINHGNNRRLEDDGSTCEEGSEETDDEDGCPSLLGLVFIGDPRIMGDPETTGGAPILAGFEKWPPRNHAP